MQGRVVSVAMQKTIKVLVERRVKHPMYGKVVRRSKKIAAHDEKQEARLGQLVTLVETRPISRTKSFKLQSIDRQADARVQSD